MAAIDHLILKVNDVAASVAFWVDVMGFTAEGERPPFTVIRVDDGFVLQLAPWGTEGSQANSRDRSSPNRMNPVEGRHGGTSPVKVTSTEISSAVAWIR